MNLNGFAAAGKAKATARLVVQDSYLMASKDQKKRNLRIKANGIRFYKIKGMFGLAF